MKFVLKKRIKEKEQEPKIDKEKKKKNLFGLRIWKDVTKGWTKAKNKKQKN